MFNLKKGKILKINTFFAKITNRYKHFKFLSGRPGHNETKIFIRAGYSPELKVSATEKRKNEANPGSLWKKTLRPSWPCPIIPIKLRPERGPEKVISRHDPTLNKKKIKSNPDPSILIEIRPRNV